MRTLIKVIQLFIVLQAGTLMAQDDVLKITNEGNVGINTTTPTQKLEVNGNAKVNGNINASGKIQERGNDLLPKGAIIMWYGAAPAPDGWAICDGGTYKEVKTPDLRDRFIVGAGNQYPLGSIGGADKVTLTVGQMPSHTHEYEFGYFREGIRFNGDVKADRALSVAFDNLKETKSVGNSEAHENRPPYYALYYIMKL